MQDNNGLTTETSEMQEFGSVAHGRWELQSPSTKCGTDYSRCVLNGPVLPNNNEDKAKLAKLTCGEVNIGTKLKNPLAVLKEVSNIFAKKYIYE